MVVLSAMPTETSQLTAIMFINIVEYTRLMGQYLAKALFQALIRIEIWISIKDNSPGIPEEIKDKIFQPFYTTKPTGSGTGLGILLSYDIIKAHGGELKVETKEGEGSDFTIQLPEI
jgi:signal transduction histidine kinase